jgi:hypothetical protein
MRPAADCVIGVINRSVRGERRPNKENTSRENTMDAIDRRHALRILACGAVVAGFPSLLADRAEATPLAMQKDAGKSTGDFKLEAQADARRPPGRPPHRPPPSHRHRRHRRRRRRWVCWWHRGRRRCGWRWV